MRSECWKCQRGRNKIKQCDCILAQIHSLPRQDNAIMVFTKEEKKKKKEVFIYMKEIINPASKRNQYKILFHARIHDANKF